MMITALDLKYIGRIGLWFPYRAKVGVKVKITNARCRFGIMDFCIEPVGGKGSQWVLAEMVSLR